MRALRNIRFSTAISGFVLAAIALTVLAISSALLVSLTGSTRDLALAQQNAALRTAATVLGGGLTGAQVEWTADEVSAIKAFAMPPSFVGDGLVDLVARVTGQDAGLYGWDGERLVPVSASRTDANGVRTLGPPLDPPADVQKGIPFVGEVEFGGETAFVGYQPISDMDGALIGMLAVGQPKARTDAVVRDTLSTILIVGAAALVVIGGLGLVGSRLMARPIARLADAMKAIAAGAYGTHIPFAGAHNEIGAMADAVAVFAENGQRVALLTADERAASQRRREERNQMMQALQQAFGDVVERAAAGDFSARVEAEFPDEELNVLSARLNSLMHAVSQGLSEAGKVLGALADADLRPRMEGRFAGAFGQLQANLDQVSGNLTSLVVRLRGTARELRDATREIRLGSDDLSERTTRQAAAIEQTLAAMEQLADTVTENARLAQRTSQRAREISEAATEGDAVMRDATAAMERIRQSSARITDIIGMIDQIAFQTNLLAINASVEAARAGEAGQGFAVVAVEVRRLAQSTAAASADVKSLIEMSGGEVSEGARLVEAASHQLVAMIEGLGETSASMETIATACGDQAVAITEVSAAVRTMDEMTQRNAALAEQINVSIDQTSQRASELDALVDVFQLAEEASARGQTDAA